MSNSRLTPEQAAFLARRKPVIGLFDLPVDPHKINNYTLSLKTVNDLFYRLSATTVDERSSMPGLEKGRETVIVPGTAVLLELMESFSFSHITVSDAGLLEGAILNAQPSQ